MEFQITRKGHLYSCDCGKCGRTLYAHEWASWDPNEERDAMQAGTLRCTECTGQADSSTFIDLGAGWYAARYSMPGYLDCTDWSFGKNKRTLAREVREMYGEIEA